MKFLFIYEDGSVEFCNRVVKEEEYNAADDGYIDIINISGSAPTQYHQGDWYGINETS